jgi:general secretion pathway protein M
LLLWGVTLLIPLLLILSLLLPWWQRFTLLDEQIDTDRDQLQRYRQIVATLPQLRAALAEEQSNDEFEAFYFDAETPALAGARLQSEVQQMIRSVEARPISTQLLPVDENEQPLRVRIRTQLQGTTEQLLDVLYLIQEARPFLFVDQMSIRSTTPRVAPQRRRNNRRTPARAAQRIGELTVRLDIFGYALGGGQ